MNKVKTAVVITAILNGAVVSQSAIADKSTQGGIEEIIIVGQLSRYGATKSVTPILETARSISIESEEMFRDKGALTLDDALNYSSGVIGDTFGYSTRGDFPKVRGFSAADTRNYLGSTANRCYTTGPRQRRRTGMVYRC